MNFQTLLANKEYTIKLRSNTFIYTSIAQNEFIFHNDNNELKCFHINSFNYISQTKFFELNYSMSNTELISLESSSLSINLDFQHESLPIIIGKCFKLKNINTISPENIINEESLKTIEDLSPLIPGIKWKFSIPDQYYYFIPNNKFCIRFNSNTYERFGKLNHQISFGDIAEVYFLNPYTIFDYYSSQFPNKNHSIYIGVPYYKNDSGPEEDKRKKTLIIRGTKRELLDTFIAFCNMFNLPYTVTDETISLHLIGFNWSDFYNTYQRTIHKALKSDYSYYQNKTSLIVEYKNSISISPTNQNGTSYTVLSFKNSTTQLQIVIHYILNDLFKEQFHANIITYNPQITSDHEQGDYIENPIDSLPEY